MKSVLPAFFVASSLLLLVACNTDVVSPPPASGKSAAASSRPKAYTARDALPAMPNRPPELVPGALPARVRYRVADDITVAHDAALLKAALESGDTAIYGDVVMVQPGAWIYLRNDLTLDLSDAGELTTMAPGQLTQQLTQGGGMKGRFFRTKHAMDLLAPEMAKLLREDGGFQVRALKTDEMAKWWTFIAFDIEEPTFVVETKGGHHHFVVGLVHDKIFILDDLDGLPNAE